MEADGNLRTWIDNFDSIMCALSTLCALNNYQNHNKNPTSLEALQYATEVQVLVRI